MKKDNSLSRVFSNTVMLYIMQISGYVFPLITFPYLTRVLGPQNYGIMLFVNSLMVYFQMFVDYGFLLSATKECAIHRDNKTKLGEILSAVIKAKVLLAFIGFIILFILINIVYKFKVNALFITLSYLNVTSSIFIPDYLFRGIEKMDSIAYRSVISRGIFTILTFLIVKNSADYIFIPILNIVANLSIIIMSWYVLIKKLNIKMMKTSLKESYKVLKESTVFFISRIASTIYGSSNTFILGLKFSSVALSQYGVASSLVTNIKTMFSPIADSIYPYMVKEKNYKLIKKILIISLPIIFIGTIGLYVFAEHVINIVCGEEYIDSIPIFKLMLPIIFMGLPIYLLGFPVLGAMGKMKEANLATIYASIYHILMLGILLILDKLSFNNVALLTCTSEAIVLILRIKYIIEGFKEDNSEYAVAN